MKKIYFFLPVILLYTSCNNNNLVDIEKASAEAENFIANQFDFFTNSSLEQAKMTFADNAILIGTDAAEYLTGWEEIEPSVKGQLIIKDPVFTSRNLNIFMSDDGKMASYTQELDFTYSIDGEPGEVKDVRNSGVIKKNDNKCKNMNIRIRKSYHIHSKNTSYCSRSTNHRD